MPIALVIIVVVIALIGLGSWLIDRRTKRRFKGAPHERERMLGGRENISDVSGQGSDGSGW